MLTLLSVDIVSLQHIAEFGVVMMLDKAPAMKSVRRPIMRAVSVPWTAGTAGKKIHAGNGAALSPRDSQSPEPGLRGQGDRTQ
jgi:hypothetical protein